MPRPQCDLFVIFTCIPPCLRAKLESQYFKNGLVVNDTEKKFQVKDAGLIHDCMNCRSKTVVTVRLASKTTKSGLRRQ